MTAKKMNKPAFYKALNDPDFYPEANRQIKCDESNSFWIFKTGPWVYKVMKPVPKLSPMLQEAYLSELVAASNRLSPQLETSMTGLVGEGDQWKLASGLAPGAAPFYVLKQKQLTDRGFLDQLLAKDKLGAKQAKDVAKALWTFHEGLGQINPKEAPGPDELLEKLKDLYYQSKKFLGQTLTKAMVDLSTRPLEVYLTDRKKLLARRVRKGFVSYYHGSLDLKRVHWASDGVAFIAKSEEAVKDRYGDRISDLADLCVALEHEGKGEWSQVLVEEYQKHCGDPDVAELLPLYRAMRTLKMGLHHSVVMGLGGPEAEVEAEKALAKSYFEQTVIIANSL
ncbi:MAG: hypothetical protein RRB13_03645 [bacterium]|nr:hypothetical protein [bacterium]